MFKRFFDFYRVSAPAAEKLPAEKADKQYRKLRLQAFVAATLGYSLYYVCRTSLNVMKQPIIDSGVLDATQLGIIGACLYWAYAVGKFVNGFLADYCNIKKFMATGLVVSAFANFMMGILGFWEGAAGIASSSMFVLFAIMWTLNGWSQSMGSPPAIISLSRWYPLKIRGTFYGFFSASHNFGEGLSFPDRADAHPDPLCKGRIYSRKCRGYRQNRRASRRYVLRAGSGRYGDGKGS